MNLSIKKMGAFNDGIYYYLKYRNIVYSGISSNIRMERFTSGNLFSSSKEAQLFNYFIESFIYAAIIILAYMVVYGKIKNIIFILLTLGIFLYAGIGSINLLISMILIFFIRIIDSGKKVNADIVNKICKTKKIRLRNIIFFAFVTLIVFVYSAWLTASRLGF